MITKERLCKKIEKVYPSVGECGLDIKAEYDESEKSWVVYLKKGKRTIKHFLPQEDVQACMDEKQCVGLGIEIAQFRE